MWVRVSVAVKKMGCEVNCNVGSKSCACVCVCLYLCVRACVNACKCVHVDLSARANVARDAQDESGCAQSRLA
jgi:hypothetical protein